MEGKRFFLYLFGGAFGILFLVGLLGAVLSGSMGKESGDVLAVIEVKGTIVGGESGSSLFGEVVAGSETMMRQIRQAADDSAVKGLLLHINSPGGSAPASEAVYNEILRFKKETGKPVMAVMSDVAASGGYFIALGADDIFANPATMTGSIGVIMQFKNYKKLYQNYGIEVETIKSGKYKDIGNPAREMTAEERELLQTMVDQIYGQFVQAVHDGRGMPEERVLELAQGQIYTGMQAKELGLVDHLGNFYDGVQYLAKKAGIEGEPALLYYRGRPSLIQRLLSSMMQAVLAGIGQSVEQGDSNELMLIEKSLQHPGIGNLQINY